ncbi:hypothetical protein [Bacteroides eggerthii]|uniref:hypothetical protein n=1 Tax=Bacteroides eggerthii TaxID=28111 RepID=UPI0018A0DB97|nr:hypothetical protein [Bacteroides eggerthii]
MKKDFDFDDIGKKTPYRVPEGFFEEMQREVQKRTYADKPASRRLWIAVPTSIAVAAALIGFLFMPSHFRQNDTGEADLQRLDTENYMAAISVDKWIREMSDEELEELVSFSENDMFLN